VRSPPAKAAATCSSYSSSAGFRSPSRGRSPDRRVRDGRCRERPAIADAEPALAAELRDIGERCSPSLRHGNPLGVRQCSISASTCVRRLSRRRLLGKSRRHAADPHCRASPADRCRASVDRTRIAGRHRGENGATPLKLALRSSVISYWKEMRSTALIKALLAAGASMKESRCRRYAEATISCDSGALLLRRSDGRRDQRRQHVEIDVAQTLDVQAAAGHSVPASFASVALDAFDAPTYSVRSVLRGENPPTAIRPCVRRRR